MVTDRLTLQQMRIDDIIIIINDVNFVRLLNSIEPKHNIDYESENDYNSILNNQKIRNSLALKLSLASAAITHRKELGVEIDDLIQLVEVELKKEEQRKANNYYKCIPGYTLLVTIWLKARLIS